MFFAPKREGHTESKDPWQFRSAGYLAGIPVDRKNAANKPSIGFEFLKRCFSAASMWQHQDVSATSLALARRRMYSRRREVRHRS